MKRVSSMMALAAALTVPALAVAGTMFRLEIGQPIAAGGGAKVKNAVLVVRAVVCDDLANARITATAEGFAGGVRTSLPVKLLSLPSPGVHAVQRQWPDGQWLLHLSGTCASPAASASTIVPLTATGFNRDRTQVLREPATPAQIAAAVAALQGIPSAGTTARR